MASLIEEINWSDLLSGADVDDLCLTFYTALNNIIDTCVPFYAQRSLKYPPWFNKEIITSLKLKDKMRTMYKTTNNAYYKNIFTRLRSQTRTLISTQYKIYMSTIDEAPHTNPKSFWTFVNSKRNTSRIPNLIQHDGETFTDDIGIANAFRVIFASVFRPTNFVPQLFTLNPPSTINSDSMNDIISVSAIMSILRSFPSKLTAGLDLIPSLVLSKCCNQLAKPLQTIFVKSLLSGVFPLMWKNTKVIPILKDGDSSLAANYRPISILPNFAKAFEKILYQHLLVSFKPVLSEYQHGFVHGRSTVSNLLMFTKLVYELLRDHDQVDVIYTDFSKAFDILDHQVLLSKLSNLNISSNLFNLLISYLTTRKNVVFCSGCFSNPFYPSSGVPQGSNLGPLLFIITLNDVVNSVNCYILIYADDIKLFLPVDDVIDCRRLLANLDAFHQWCITNNLTLNPLKCNVLTFFKSSFTHFDYTIDGVTLPRVSHKKDLGITFDRQLNFKSHIDRIVSEANRMLGFIIRLGRNIESPQALKTLFFTFVRSKLEYCDILWTTSMAKYVDALEKCQRKFLKFLSFKKTGTYPARGTDYVSLLAEFDFTSLASRRRFHCVIYLLKLLRNIVDSQFLLSRIPLVVPQRISRTSTVSQFYLPVTHNSRIYKAPMYMLCNTANNTLCNFPYDLFFDSLSSLLRAVYDYCTSRN